MDDTLVNAATATVALAALGVAVWEAHTSRDHARRSVRPLLVLERHWVEPNVKILVRNAGVGPAVLKRSDYFVDNRLVRDQGSGALAAALNEVQVPNVPTTVWSLAGTSALTAGDEIPIFQVRSAVDQATANSLKNGCRRISISLAYESVYGERFSLIERFHREVGRES